MVDRKDFWVSVFKMIFLVTRSGWADDLDYGLQAYWRTSNALTAETFFQAKPITIFLPMARKA